LKVNELNNLYADLGKLAQDAHNKINSINAETIGSTLKKENTATKKAEQEYNSTASGKNSTADLG